MNKEQEALQWIVSLLGKHTIPFQITGGLAGIVYGSGRPLHDIDIDMPEDRMEELVPDVQKYIQFGPKRFKGDDFDLKILTLNYKGMQIDLTGSNETCAFNKTSKSWKPIPCNLSTAQKHSVLDVQAPVVDPQDFMTYKYMLNRTIDGMNIDLIDAEAAKKFLESHI